jgi:hypothetical protein
MADNIRDFLTNRQRELKAQLLALQTQIDAKVVELAEVEKASAAIGFDVKAQIVGVGAVGEANQAMPIIAAATGTAAGTSNAAAGAVALTARLESKSAGQARGPQTLSEQERNELYAEAIVDQAFERMQRRAIPAHLRIAEYSPIATPNQSSTIRDLILLALRSFPITGAKTSELRQFITDAYRRDIDRASFTPQLSKLKADGVLDQDGPTGRWSLAGISPDEMRERGIIPPQAVVVGEPEKKSPSEMPKGDSKITEGSEPPFKRRV